MNKDAIILLVEDNDGDIVLIIEAFKNADVTNEVKVVKNGEEALKYLRKEGAYKNEVTPSLILLDINLPIMDGKELLATIKKDESLLFIPVIMLTTSDSQKDIMDCYLHHANCYITKSSDFEKLMTMVCMIKSFWLNMVNLPLKES